MDKSKHLKLKSPSRYIVIPIIVVIFFLIFFTIYEDIRKKTINEFNNEQLQLAETASQGITSFFNNYQSDLAFLTTLNEIIDFSDKSKTLMANFYEDHKNIVKAITRVDAKGVILYTYPYDQSYIGQDISNQKHIQQVITEHKPVISDVFLTVQGYLAVALHVPVFKNKKFVGSIALLIPMNELGEFYLGKIENNKKGHAWLISENGIEIYCSIKRHTGKSFLENSLNNNATIDLFEQIKIENSGTVKGFYQDSINNGNNGPDDMNITFCRIPLGNTYWTILISYQEKEVYTALAQFRNRLIFVFFLLFIAISFYFYSLAKVRKILKEETKRKHVEESLKESEEKYRTLVENSLEGIGWANGNKLIFANKVLAEMFGYDSVDELLEIPLLDLVAPESKDLITDRIKKREQKVELPNHYEYKIIKKDGQIRDVEISNHEIFVNNEYVVQSSLRDITERKQFEKTLLAAKEKAEESDRLKSAFLANISHEIRTPMNGILGFAELLKEPELTYDKQQEYIKIIESSGVRMLNIINAIVDISKIEAGIVEMKISETNVNEQIKYVYTFFKPEADKKGIQFTITKT